MLLTASQITEELCVYTRSADLAQGSHVEMKKAEAICWSHVPWSLCGSATALLSTNAVISAVTSVSSLMKDAFCVTAEKKEGNLAVRKSRRSLRVLPGSAPSDEPLELL